jgi:ferredoxin
MKWPIITTSNRGLVHSVKWEYFTRTVEYQLDSELCTTCRQCVRVCPHNALEMPKIEKGAKVTKGQRVPFFPDPLKCVACGVCMALCPVKAISLAIDENTLAIPDLPIIKAQVFPTFKKIKVGSVELEDPAFKSVFWDKIHPNLAIHHK